MKSYVVKKMRAMYKGKDANAVVAKDAPTSEPTTTPKDPGALLSTMQVAITNWYVNKESEEGDQLCYNKMTACVAELEREFNTSIMEATDNIELDDVCKIFFEQWGSSILTSVMRAIRANIDAKTGKKQELRQERLEMIRQSSVGALDPGEEEGLEEDLEEDMCCDPTEWFCQWWTTLQGLTGKFFHKVKKLPQICDRWGTSAMDDWEKEEGKAVAKKLIMK